MKSKSRVKRKLIKKKNLKSRRKIKISKKKSRRKSIKRKKRSYSSKKKEYTLEDKYFKGNLKIFSKDYCGYCKDLKKMLETDLGLKFEEISQEQAEKYRLQCDEIKNSQPFTTVPQLFSIIKEKNKEKLFYLGGHNDTEKIIENLKKYKNENLNL